MSEFRIVKCKSCTAPLVELEGEKLTKCVQCGYDFSQKTSKKAKLESVVEQAFEKQLEKINTSNNSNPKASHQPAQTRSTPNSQTTNTQTVKKKTLSNTTKKNQGSIIGTIIKWYLIIFIASKVIQEFF